MGKDFKDGPILEFETRPELIYRVLNVDTSHLIY